MKRKIVSSTLRKERLWRFHGTQPGSQKNYKTHVKASSRASMSLKGTSPHQTYLGPHQFTPKCSSKQGFSAQEGNTYQPYNVDLWNKVSFDIQPTNPQADITATGHYCEYWITAIDLMEYQEKSTLSSPDDTMLPEVYTDTVACIYNVDGKCKSMLTPERLHILQKSFIRQSATAYTATLNLHPLALHQNS